MHGDEIAQSEINENDSASQVGSYSTNHNIASQHAWDQAHLAHQMPPDNNVVSGEDAQQKEQARLLLAQQFKQLRDYQSSRQQQLVLAHQQQLAVLREEQNRISLLLATQQNPWQNSPHDMSGGGGSPMPMSVNASHLANLAGLARTTPGGTAQVQLMNGRPAPILPERPCTPEEYQHNGDPSLDSDTATIESASNVGWANAVYPPSSNIVRLPLEATQLNTNCSNAHWANIHDPNQHHNTQRQTSYPVQQMNGDHGQARHAQNAMLDFREEEEEEEEDINSESEEFMSQPDESFPGHANGEDFLYGDDEEDNGYDDDENDGGGALDDKPVTVQGRTFEELLEEKLRQESEQQLANNSAPAKPAKRQFLRRGEGIARFNSAPKQPVKPPPRSRKSDESVRNQETGNKPTPPMSANNKNTVKASAAPKRPSLARKPIQLMACAKNTAAAQRAMKSQETNKLQDSSKQKQKTKPQDTSKSQTTSMSQDTKASKLHDASKAKDNKAQNANKAVENGTASSYTPSWAEDTNVKSVGQLRGRIPMRPPPTLQLHARKQSPALSNGIAASAMNVKSAKLPENGAGDADVSMGDVSFMNCMQERAKNEVVEAGELDDFEYLEQMADDNASFLSNLSVVERKLHNEKLTKTQHCPATQMQQQYADTRPGILDEVQEDTSDAASSLSDSDDSEDDTAIEDRTLTEPAEQNTNMRPQRKVAALKSTQPSTSSAFNTAGLSANQLVPPVCHSPPPPQTADNQPQMLVHLSRVDHFSSSDDTVEGASHDLLNKLYKQIPDHVSSIELRRRSEGSSRQGTDMSLPSSQSACIPTDNVTDPSEDARATSAPPVATRTNSQAFDSEDSEGTCDDDSEQDEFDDDDTWDESMRESTPIKPSTNKAEQKKSAITISKVCDDNITPPTSKLVSKLFPKLKQDKPPAAPPTQEFPSTAAPVVDPAQSTILREKLNELEQEIERFRTENSTLSRLRKDREQGLAQLQREVEEFEKQKQQELERLQEFKAEETRKLKRERKLFDQYQKAARAIPDKRDREEIESLKKQLTDTQEEMRRKETRWTTSSQRLRDRLTQVETENMELKEEIKILEKRRIEEWQRRDTGSINTKEETNRKFTGSSNSMSSMQTSPRPQAMPQSLAAQHHPLSASNHELDATEDTGSETSEAACLPSVYTDFESLRQPEMTPMPIGLTPSDKSLIQDSAPTDAMRASIPRKRAVLPSSISDVVDKGNEEYEEMQHSDGKVEKIYSNGAREILFANGTRKQVSKDGQSIIVSFFNGDMKQILSDQRVVYYYAEAQTTHTTYPDGLEILQFPNQQTEKHYPDGTKEISFPDHTIKYLFPNGSEESIFPDGTVIRLESNGQRTMEFPNGQRELHTQQYKRREYPDGTVKTVYPDGRQETRYSSGRIRVKDKDGQVIVDKRV